MSHNDNCARCALWTRRDTVEHGWCKVALADGDSFVKGCNSPLVTGRAANLVEVGCYE